MPGVIKSEISVPSFSLENIPQVSATENNDSAISFYSLEAFLSCSISIWISLKVKLTNLSFNSEIVL